MNGSGCSCSPSVPTPTASQFGCKDVPRMLARRRRCKERTGNGNGFGLTLGQWAAVNLGTPYLHPEFVEALLRFPVTWTESAASATP
jgi:hypothetical protein